MPSDSVLLQQHQHRRLGHPSYSSLSLLATTAWVALLASRGGVASALSNRLDSRDDGNPLNIQWGPAPAPEDGPAASANALRDPAYLPAQIGAIVGAYGVALVLVAITLLALSKRRRQHIQNATLDLDYELDHSIFKPHPAPHSPTALQIDTIAVSPRIQNFSYPSPTKTDFSRTGGYVQHLSTSTLSAPGVDYSVDQRVVQQDRAMGQQQLEDMYKYVMEHEDAKERGTPIEGPLDPILERQSISERSTKSGSSKKERSKPANLNLSGANEEKTQSRTSSILSALRSPRKKNVKGVSISSPIMTPQSGTFPREQQDISIIPPRHYAPPPPPPIPTDQVPYGAAVTSNKSYSPITPDISPESVQSIDERIGSHLSGHNRNISQAPTEVDPESAISENSQAPLIGLPASPKPGASFPSLPSSPKPGATFQRSNAAPSAVRTGGSLPLRAYESSMASPSAVPQTTKQTVFERKGPLSPTGRTPFTAGATPYTPYQPYTPCMPVTPSLVTKEERKRMRRMVPKTPTMEMVQDTEDVW